MDKKDFEKKLANIKIVEPDNFDNELINSIGDDMKTTPLEQVESEIEYSGKISLRIPRSLHKELAEEAKREGISLNQYALYRLSKTS